MSNRLAFIIAMVVLVAISAGLFMAGGNQFSREQRFDRKRLADLFALGHALGCEHQNNAERGILPESLDLASLETHCEIPYHRSRLTSILTDPVTEQPYDYHRLDDYNFRLCASFSWPDTVAIYNHQLRDGDLHFDPATGCVSGTIEEPA